MIVSDLTYVRVQQNWHYICVLVDLYNREIIGYSAGPHKDAVLVQRAFATVKYNLNRLELFHTDRGSEFKNKLIDQALETFSIERSFSEKGTPYDDAVAEAHLKRSKQNSFMVGFSLANRNLILNFSIMRIGSTIFEYMGPWII